MKNSNFSSSEPRVYHLPLILPESLENQRKEFENIIIRAQNRIKNFAINYRWENFIQESFIDRVEIYDNKKDFDKALLEQVNLPITTELPKTYSAALENRVLIAVSPDLYAKNYSEGKEKDSYEKLLAHEIAHRLHIRILNGIEEDMGPIWFFEGFAIFAANQFENLSNQINQEEIQSIITSTERGDYRKYAEIFRYFSKKFPLSELIEYARKKEFVNWLLSKE